MNQYCRYCNNASYQGDNYAVCVAQNKWNGTRVKQTTVRKSCKEFEFNELDVFSPDHMEVGFHKYSPRGKYNKGIQGQMRLEL